MDVDNLPILEKANSDKEEYIKKQEGEIFKLNSENDLTVCMKEVEAVLLKIFLYDKSHRIS